MSQVSPVAEELSAEEEVYLDMYKVKEEDLYMEEVKEGDLYKDEVKEEDWDMVEVDVEEVVEAAVVAVAVVVEAVEEAAKGTKEGTIRDSAVKGEASAEARKPHNSHNVTNHPRQERATKSNIASIFIHIKPHGSGGVLYNKQLNSSTFPNHLTKKDKVTNKKGINLNNDNGKKTNKNRDKEPKNNTN